MSEPTPVASRATDDDAALLRAFETCTLPSDAFRHRDHIRLAWLHLRAWPFAEAAARFSANLRLFAASVGRPGLYHETITWAYLTLVHERMQASPASDFDEFACANGALLDHRAGALMALYDRETLDSPLARRVFVLPRRRP